MEFVSAFARLEGEVSLEGFDPGLGLFVLSV